MIEPVITKRGTRFLAARDDTFNAMPAVTFVVEGKWPCPFRLQDYLTADECMTLAAQLTMAAIASEPGAYVPRAAEVVRALRVPLQSVPQDEPA